MTIDNWKSRGLIAGGTVLVLWAAVTLVMHSNSVKAEGDRVFEIHVYHVAPGKMPAMETRFRDKISKLLARHNLNVLGYWVADDPSDYSFVFMVAHANPDEAKQNWAAMRADPDFQEVIKAEQSEKLAQKIDVRIMRPTDFSALR